MPRRRTRARKGQSQRSGPANTSLSYLPTSVPRSFSFGATVGFPRKLHVRHRIVFNYRLTAGVPLVYSCNGMYDPELSILGHQPLYFDQLAAIYAHYTVFASTIKVDMVALNVIATPVTVYISPNPTPVTNYFQATEQPSASTTVVSGMQGPGHGTLSNRWSAKEYFGGNIYDNDDLQGSGTANPVEQSYYVILSSNVDAAEPNLQCYVTITFDAVWDELRTMALS